MDWKIPLFKISWDDEDIEMVKQSIQRGMFWAAGPEIAEFEKLLSDHLGVKYAVTFNSGTSALHAVLLAYGVGQGDEVIVPSFTFIATANAPLFVGARPVFADIEETSYGLNPDSVRSRITPQTKAIIPVHYGGCPCLVAELKAIAEEHNLLLIEDAAESFGARRNGKQVGTFGDAAMFSLCQTKVFTTGEGGFIVTDSRDIGEKLKLIRSHGRAETADYFSSVEYMDYVTLGYNFRMPTITAALGISQLRKVDRLTEMRRTNSQYLTEVLSGIKDIVIPEFPEEVFHVYQEYAIKVKAGVKARDSLRAHLTRQGIMTRISFYPIHLTHFYKNVLKYDNRGLDVTERVSAQALTLPMYPWLTKEEMDYIAQEVRSFFSKGRSLMNYSVDEQIAKLTVNENDSIKTTMRAIDNGALGIAFVVDAEGKFVGLVTDGDIRGAILRGVQIEKPVREIANTKPIVIQDKMTEEELMALQGKEPVKSKLAIGYSLKIPVLDSQSRVRDIGLLYHGGRKPARLSQYRSKYWGAVKKVLVIGCAGYVGSVLTRQLLSQGYIVNGLDNLMYGDYGIKELYGKNGFNFTKGDIRDLKVLMESIKGCDAVVHLAAIVGDPACQLDAEETISINYLATRMITEVCQYSQINRFIFASTCSVYGATNSPGVLLTEDSELNPVSLYAEMKLKSERAIMEAIDDNFSPTILRKATLYGLSPRMRFDLVVNLLTAKATTEGKITIFGGNQWRPLLHVSDAAEAYIRCLKTPIEEVRGQIFNVGSNQQNYTIQELGNILKSIIPSVKIENRDDLVDERNYSVAFDKVANLLGYKAKRTIQDGILEIKRAFAEGIIGDYTDKRYSNYESLSESKEIESAYV